ncbi:hypothetical protein XELAEV_18002276mg [Xenopus laevis]|nr:hypothetical protein XELAEV_18002276mg [Xenopus laevis]
MAGKGMIRSVCCSTELQGVWGGMFCSNIGRLEAMLCSTAGSLGRKVLLISWEFMKTCSAELHKRDAFHHHHHHHLFI